ncbi:MAG: hypothetical protein VYE68_01150 [Acidobacteriota bacterium]|nr:hypothetical protein [Acidobacteriota bacterium]
MSGRVGSTVLLVMVICATPVWAQPDEWAGTYRGELTSAAGENTPISLTLIGTDGDYTGLVGGFSRNTEVRLSRVVVDGTEVTLEATTETDFGPLAFVYRLTRDERNLGGQGSVTLGSHGFDVTLELRRTRRTDVPQPQIEPRIGYFAGTWRFEYTGGEFPPLSVGTRNGMVTFHEVPHGPFVRAEVQGDIFGDEYEETWTIGFDRDTNSLVWHEQLSDGQTLTALGNWTSPIAITFLTAPVVFDDSVYVLKRIIRTTSDTAFSVTDEFSVDGGPFRRLGNGAYLRNETSNGR